AEKAWDPLPARRSNGVQRFAHTQGCQRLDPVLRANAMPDTPLLQRGHKAGSIGHLLSYQKSQIPGHAENVVIVQQSGTGKGAGAVFPVVVDEFLDRPQLHLGLAGAPERRLKARVEFVMDAE